MSFQLINTGGQSNLLYLTKKKKEEVIFSPVISKEFDVIHYHQKIKFDVIHKWEVMCLKSLYFKHYYRQCTKNEFDIIHKWYGSVLKKLIKIFITSAKLEFTLIMWC